MRRGAKPEAPIESPVGSGAYGLARPPLVFVVLWDGEGARHCRAEAPSLVSLFAKFARAS